MSSLIQTAAPVCEPVSLVEAKAWLRVDADEEDPLILGLIAAARSYVETFTRRALITQGFELGLDSFPGRCRFLAGNGRISETRGHSGQFAEYHSVPPSREITLPRAPLAAVASVKYYDPAGALQTMDPAQYFVDVRTEPGRVVLNANFDWPDTDLRPGAVIIAYTVGYGTPSAVPAAIRTAIRFMLAAWFEQRVPVETGLRAAAIEVPMSVEAILWQHRLPSFV